jgi:hypothetical protein
MQTFASRGKYSQLPTEWCKYLIRQRTAFSTLLESSVIALGYRGFNKADVAGREATTPPLGLMVYSNSSTGFNAASASAIALFALIDSNCRPSFNTPDQLSTLQSRMSSPSESATMSLTLNLIVSPLLAAN